MIANVGIIGNDSASNPVVDLANASHCPNEDSVDEGAQTEALDAARVRNPLENKVSRRGKSKPPSSSKTKSSTRATWEGTCGLVRSYNTNRTTPSPQSGGDTKSDPVPWRHLVRKVLQEINQLFWIAVPSILTGFLVCGKSFTSTFVLGRIGELETAGGSLSNAITNITGFSVIYGLSMGMDGITPQAYGASNFTFMDRTLHQTVLILLTTTIPITILWLNAKPKLIFAGQDVKVSEMDAT
ncbi:protein DETOXIFICATION 49 [Artemisia annua]|uniref:Protein DETOXIFICATION 49 n=1 Tax=Artemisia annua TaxID=35608 RepID=A0A2U1LS01_ARTAN|nr:protein DETOXIFICATION 49 [Artemisia annua]